jgi:hypothetical protein
VASYRRSKKVGPLRFTVSQRGISTSIGGGPLRITYGADGKVRRTIRAPGTGFYDTRVIGGKTSSPRRSTPPVPTGGMRLTLEQIKAYSPSQNELLRYLAVQLLWPAALFGWVIYWLFTVGLWFIAVGGIVGIFIAAVKSTAKRQYTKALEAYEADQPVVAPSAAPVIQKATVTPKTTPAEKTTTVRCFRCQHTQKVAVSASAFECEKCNTKLKRRVETS